MYDWRWLKCLDASMALQILQVTEWVEHCMSNFMTAWTLPLLGEKQTLSQGSSWSTGMRPAVCGHQDVVSLLWFLRLHTASRILKLCATNVSPSFFWRWPCPELRVYWDILTWLLYKHFSPSGCLSLEAIHSTFLAFSCRGTEGGNVMAKSLKLIAGQCHPGFLASTAFHCGWDKMIQDGNTWAKCCVKALIRKDVSLEVSGLSFNEGTVFIFERWWMSFQIRSYQSYATESGTKQKMFLK